MNKYASCDRICVYMHNFIALSDAIFVTHEESDWIYPLYYEHVPFKCRKWHQHNHLCRDFLLNKVRNENMKKEEKDVEGFQKIWKKRQHIKNGSENSKRGYSNHPQQFNSFGRPTGKSGL